MIPGFGCGSKELSIPTANLPLDGLPSTIESGIYYGWAGLDLTPQQCGVQEHQGRSGRGTVLPFVASIGYNPFYKNNIRSVVCFTLMAS